MTWLLLIYTVPSTPSRKRASVWRELKKAGAIYLRDGVAVLPERGETRAVFQAIAAKVEELGGQAILVEGACLDPMRAEAIVAQVQDNRAEEYAEIVSEAKRLLAHTEQERTHRAFTVAELEELAGDLGKLRRWAEQVRARDYFHSVGKSDVGAVLEQCERALALCFAQANGRTEGIAS